MAYSTIAQVRQRNTLLLTSVADAIITEAIEEADSYVDGMLGSRYSVPFSSVPALIRGISADLAAGTLLIQHTGNTGTNDEPTQGKVFIDRAEDRLKALAGGDMSLPGASVSAQVCVRSSTYNDTRKFASWDPDDPTTYEE